MSFKRKYTEEELVTLVKDKSTEAFSSLYDNYSAALYGVILKVVTYEEQAQDILQDSFVKIWNNFSSYDAAKGKLFTWMLNIARNTAIDALRSKQGKMDAKNQSIDNSVYEVNAQTKVTTSVDHIGLKEVLKKLRPDYVTLIDMAYFKGYTQEEISQELNIPLGTVKTRVRTALNQLREILKVK
ncbi:MAG: sigma-70 family RNA polymerase sigma factor [Bacteroidia bacterium]